MSFTYYPTPTSTTKTTTFQSKPLLCKSFLVDISAGSLGESGTTYTIGYLPKDAQFIAHQTVLFTAVTGAGPITASTVSVALNGTNFLTSLNAFATASSNSQSSSYLSGFFANGPADNDQAITYTFTHTGGTTPSTGRFYIHIFYVV